MQEEKIRNFSGEIIGIVRTEANGDKVAIDFPSRLIVGKYKKQYDYTTDFYGVVVAKGDAVVSLIYQNKNK